MSDNVLNDVSINSFTADLEVSDTVNEGEIVVKNGHSPYIGTNGNWYEYDDETEEYTDTEVKAEGPQGPRGETGPAGTNGTDGAPGTPGTNGISPTVSTAAITGGTAVTITDVNGPHTFNVMNGQPGQNGQDGSDYVLTAQDKADIAALVVPLLPVYDGSVT